MRPFAYIVIVNMKGYGTYSDAALSELLQKGDYSAFTEIHHRYYTLLYSHALRRLPNREEVQDLLQDLFASIWTNREVLVLNTGLAPYLYTATRNRVINVFSRQKVRDGYVRSLQRYLAEGENVTDRMVREKELIAIVEREIAALPAQMRKVFELSRNGHLSHQEIAVMMNTSPLTVRKQIQNSLKILRSRLGTSMFLLFF